jgi:anaphase-promoting complex subunit 10
MPTTTRRHALATLEQNADLQERAEVKRPPISYDQENEHAVHFGVAEGIYTWDEIVEVTNRLAVSRVDLQDDDAAAHGLEADEDDADEPPRVSRADDMQGGDDPTDDMIDEEIEENFGEEEDDGDLGGEGDFDGEVEGDGEGDQDQDMQAEEEAQAVHFDPAALGLKEINNLAHFGVSSHKPGNGVEEMLSEDLERYWQ